MTAFKNVQEELHRVLADNAIAEIANRDYSVWQRRVFYGIDNGFTMIKNRGALPFIEYEVDSEFYSSDTAYGGQNTIAFRIRIKVGGLGLNNSKLNAQEKIKKMQTNIFRLAREIHMLSAGEEQINITELVSEPWGFYQDCIIPIDLTYERSDFGDHDN